ncbi:MAG TPA: hypothetical protein VM120_01640 [Bryobacteraceae bacterium]|nr:hypothetical protein [Bryobacteraceae bacterium]
MPIGRLPAFGWLPFLPVDLGNLGGGWLSGRMVRGGWTIASARQAVLAIGVVAMLAEIPAGLTSDTRLCVVLIALATFGYRAWGTMMLALPTICFHPRSCRDSPAPVPGWAEFCSPG